jgi:hypothetical protein
MIGCTMQDAGWGMDDAGCRMEDGRFTKKMNIEHRTSNIEC